MEYFELTQAKQRHADFIAEAQNEAREVAPLPYQETWVGRVVRLVKSVFSRRGEAAAQLPRHA